MNLADYLSELLGQYEEVSVPGLGYFVRERVNGYYNDKEARFYPPHHKVKFVPQPKDDDIFAQYVADKKNISLASSKYFAEKFVSKLREQALTGKYLFADLGLFYTDQGQLAFKPNDKITDDPAFYGYPQLNIYKQGQPLNEQSSRPGFANVAPTPATPPQPVIDEPYFEEEAERKRGLSIWMIILIAVTVVALAVFGVYKFYPEAFDKVGAAYSRMTGKADTAVPIYRHEVAADSIKKTVPVPAKDTTAKTTPPVTTVVDSVKQPSWVIIVKTFAAWQHKSANNEVNLLKAKNIEATILTKEQVIGPRIKVSTGTYATQNEAEAAKSILIAAGKIPKNSDVVQLKQ